MIALALLTALPASAPVDQPRTFLASIVHIPLKRDEAIESFSFETWGAKYKAVCHIPEGWNIKAGGSLTPAGVLKGEGSLGVTWYRQNSPKEFRALVLLELYGPVQRHDVGRGASVVPATFKGYATVSTDDGERKIPLNADNIKLSRAKSCSTR